MWVAFQAVWGVMSAGQSLVGAFGVVGAAVERVDLGLKFRQSLGQGFPVEVAEQRLVEAFSSCPAWSACRACR